MQPQRRSFAVAVVRINLQGRNQHHQGGHVGTRRGHVGLLRADSSIIVRSRPERTAAPDVQKLMHVYDANRRSAQSMALRQGGKRIVWIRVSMACRGSTLIAVLRPCPTSHTINI